MRYITNSAQDTLNLGKGLAKKLKAGDILCLYGNLGAGKTVFAKGIAEGLGINKDKVISPSFVLIREHKGRLPLYHFDLYRLKAPKEIIDLGYDEYLYGRGVSVVEWADRLGACLPKSFLKIEFQIKGKDQRVIEIKKIR